MVIPFTIAVIEHIPDALWSPKLFADDPAVVEKTSVRALSQKENHQTMRDTL
jgi:hypothetical protein